MHTRPTLLLAIIVLFCLSVAAQRPPGGTGGGAPSGPPSTGIPSGQTMPSEIQVRISWENERPIDESVHVQLISMGGVPLFDSFSTREGTVSFKPVPPGTYHLHVDGSDIQEVTTNSFSVYPQEANHMEWVHVSPKQNAATKTVPGAGPTVSASDLNVPDKAKNELDKGMEAYAKGDTKKAAEKLLKAVEIYPRYARAWNNLAVIRMKDNDKAGAKEAWQKAIEADDKFSSAYLNLARLSLLDKNSKEAESLVNKSLSVNPNNPEALALMAKAQLLDGDYDKALASVRKANTMPHEHLADIHLIAGEALLHLGQSSEAIKEYETYLKEYPDSPGAAKVRAAMAQIQAKKQN